VGHRTVRGMNTLLPLGRFFFAIPMMVFGIQYLVYAHFVLGLPPVPPTIPGRPFWAYFTGAVLIVIGVSIVTKLKARLYATLLAIMFFLCAIFLHVPVLAAHPHNGSEWAGASEVLAICGGALVLAGTMPVEWPYTQEWGSVLNNLTKLGQYLFALSLVIFGTEHFIYAHFVAALIPSWIPWHLFWAYFTGVAFLAAAASIFTRMQVDLAATLLGIMFLLWVLLLHIPRVATHPRNGTEWTSAFVALAMCGAAFVLAGTSIKRKLIVSEVAL